MTTYDLSKNVLSLLKAMLDDKIITPQNLAIFANGTNDPYDPEYVRYEMETWYRTRGIEEVLNRPFSLSTPPYTHEELADIQERQEILLCVPKGIHRRQLGLIFNLSSWALEDELVADATEVEDFWFTTKKSLIPEHLNKTGLEVQKIFDNEGKLGMSLSRYMVFISRTRYLTGETPDVRNWIWLHRGRYDQKSMLIAGIDSHLKFNVHAWLPHFQGALCGARSVSISDHL